MAKQQNTQEAWQNWVGDTTEEELEAMIVSLRKRKWIYLAAYVGILVVGFLIAVIIVTVSPWSSLTGYYLTIMALMGVAMGCACFANNNLRYMVSRGTKGAHPLGVWFYLLLGFILPPIIVVQLCSRIESLGNLVLGWTKKE